LPLNANQQRIGMLHQYVSAQRWEQIFFAVSNQKGTHPLQNPVFHKSSTSFILSALAFCDLSMVIVRMLQKWLMGRFHIDIRTITSFGCKFHLFLAYYTTQVRGFFIKLMSHARWPNNATYYVAWSSDDNDGCFYRQNCLNSTHTILSSVSRKKQINYERNKRPMPQRGDWKCEKWKSGTITNASRENTRHENAAPMKMRDMHVRTMKQQDMKMWEMKIRENWYFRLNLVYWHASNWTEQNSRTDLCI